MDSSTKGTCGLHYLDTDRIDTDTDTAVIMDVEATRSIRQAEVGASSTMIERVETRFGLKPTWLAADTA